MKTLCMPAKDDMSSLLRVQWPAEILRGQGADIEISDEPWMVRERNRIVAEVQAPDCDVIVLCRPQHQGVAQSIPLLQAAGIAVVVDYDDDLSAVHPANHAAAAFDPARDPRSNWLWAQECARHADLVTVSTPALLDVYAPHGRGIVIPNRLPSWRLPQPARRDGPVRLGWPGFIGTHPTDLLEMDGAPGRVLRRSAEPFWVIGGGDGFSQAERNQHVRTIESQVGCRVRTTGHIGLDAWPDALTRLDIGVAPLAHTRFNASKCLDAETRVATRRGILRVADIRAGDAVWHDGRWVNVEATAQDETRDGLRITTASGRQLTLTREHRLWRHDMWAQGWTQAQDLSEGDLIALAPDEIGATDLVRMPWPSDSRMSRGEHDRHAFTWAEDVPVITITERWGRFLGIFAGDGSASGTQVGIHCDGQDKDLIELVSEDIRQLGLWPATQHVRTWGGEVLRRRSVTASSAHLIRFLRSLGVVEADTVRRIVRVPDVIWRSPRSVVQQFLAGLFEADGSCAGSSVSLSTKHHSLALDVQRLLAAFGIDATIRGRTNTAVKDGPMFPSWLVVMNKVGLVLFEKEIGFLSERKRQRLAAIAGRPTKPTSGRGVNRVPKPQTWTDTIVRIEPLPVRPVDLQVEGSIFAAAGFLSHNSALKSLELAAAGVAVVASPIPDNRRIARDGLCVLAESPNDWTRQLRRLMDSESARREQAERARAGVERHLLEPAVGAWWDAWQQARANHDRSSVPASYLAAVSPGRPA